MNDLNSCRLLLVDDTKTNIDLLVAALMDDYILSVALNGPSALHIAAKLKPDLILLDVMMPEMDGFAVCQQLKADPETSDIPVIFLTAMDDPDMKSKGFQFGAVDYITKPFHAAEVKARVRNHLSLLLARRQLARQNSELEHRVQERTRELEHNYRDTLLRLGLAAEYRDNDTGRHIRRIREFTALLARKSGCTPKEAEDMGLAATMHDIGKIGIPDAILLKPGKLDAQEWQIMQRHAQIGADILACSNSPLLNLSRTIALTHHERWDGTGYPQGLAGETIPLAGRIVGLVDVFDALTSDRPYKPAWSVAEAAAVIHKERGAHFDPALVDLFLDDFDAFLHIYDQHKDGAPGNGSTLALLEEIQHRVQEEEPQL
ncbi:HD domain-containing phosphohydrolase [Megalodesulfovibrio gigas]|uniref:Putative response regulator receiver modulated metal dependent phosphohydrolase n=1 Tax=Megalodesulfovibrio gigas (strain ATCC 19364 / DSM 1382 / NCIMB 9332 / VKM B-1759) TaxID=1121448 RepID=T2GA62_MEGG1|nr:HD domain-containing phosphohydrolase [Megalodesulfovibrio gigas]AGW13163.1 putative response regulator receiver modulated metal dependent phosphohydrolase [Megalodesulfovibrio gigas DSM 1382 = ATCC 19364]